MTTLLTLKRSFLLVARKNNPLRGSLSIATKRVPKLSCVRAVNWHLSIDFLHWHPQSSPSPYTPRYDKNVVHVLCNAVDSCSTKNSIAVGGIVTSFQRPSYVAELVSCKLDSRPVVMCEDLPETIEFSLVTSSDQVLTIREDDLVVARLHYEEKY